MVKTMYKFVIVAIAIILAGVFITTSFSGYQDQ